MPGIRTSRSIAAALTVLAIALLSRSSMRTGTTPIQQPSRESSSSPTPSLETLLVQMAEYCRKLESSAFDLVCREEIRESIDPKLDAAQSSPLDGPPTGVAGVPPSNATLQTSIVVWSTALLAPAGFFGERSQPGYDFTIAGRDRIDETPVVVIDAKPKPGGPPARNLYGKAFIRSKTDVVYKDFKFFTVEYEVRDRGAHP